MLRGKRKIIINGHGAKTDTNISLPKGCTLFCPESLQVDYELSVGHYQGMEPAFLRGELNQVANGNWVKYSGNNSVPNVRINPWRNLGREFYDFKKIIHDPYKWSDIDHVSDKLYLNRDKDAVLVVRNRHGKLENISDKEKIKTYLETHDPKNQNSEFTPVFFYAPKVAKIKILGATSLDEITKQLPLISPDDDFDVVLATCNAGPMPKSVVVDFTASPINLTQIKEATPLVESKAEFDAPHIEMMRFLKQSVAQDVKLEELKLPDLKKESLNRKYGLTIVIKGQEKTFWTTPLIQMLYLAQKADQEDKPKQAMYFLNQAKLMLQVPGIDINMTQDQPATTALHKAIFYGGTEDPRNKIKDPEVKEAFRDIARTLLDNGARTDIKNEQGFTVDYDIEKEGEKGFAKWIRDERFPPVESVVEQQVVPQLEPQKPKPLPSYDRTKGFFEEAKMQKIQQTLLQVDKTIQINKKQEEKKEVFVVSDNIEVKFEIHPQKIATKKNNVKNYETILKCFKAANPDSLPHITTGSEAAKTKWMNAIGTIYADKPDKIEQIKQSLVVKPKATTAPAPHPS